MRQVPPARPTAKRVSRRRLGRWWLLLLGVLTAAALVPLIFCGSLDPLQTFRSVLDGMAAAEPLPRPDFRWGIASAAYQIEGAHDEDGRGPSIWDTFSHTPGRTHNSDTGDVAVDFYHRYAEDIALMKSMGVQMFRFSVSWSRILPKGTSKVNQAGIDFYNKVINALLEAGIEPHLTLYHWDIPQALEDKYQGWLSEKVLPDFVEYAEVCFRAFGDRVEHWTTFNEPWSFVWIAYSDGIHAPGRCSDRSRCSAGDSRVEPWIATHNVLNAHAAAVARFRELVPRGKISTNLNSDWAEPASSSAADQEAAQRHLDFTLGIYADPIFRGDYPASVRERVDSLPRFTPEQQRLLKGSVDYFALNHYTSKWVADNKDPENVPGTRVFTKRKCGTLIGPQADSEWLNVVPWGFGKLLTYVHKRYGGPEIFVTENGVDVPNESSLPLAGALQDDFRITYYKGYLSEAVKAVQEHGVRLKGYFAWSILDNFEWADGYAKRFGIVHVDYQNGLKRTVKASGKWLSALFSQPTS